MRFMDLVVAISEFVHTTSTYIMYDGMIIVESEKLEPGKLYGQHLAHVFRFFIPLLQVIIIHIISLCLLLVHGHVA